jgi:copper chaperone CopZ
MNKYAYTVASMNCNGCVSNIRQALESNDQINEINIQLSKKLVEVESSLSFEEVAQIIEEAGYEALAEKEKKGILGNLFSR